MRRRPRGRALCAAAVLFFSAVGSAAAQSPRVVFGLSGGVQSAAKAVPDRFEFESNVETATVDVKYPAAPAVMIDGSVGVRLWKQIGAGVAVSNATRDGSAEIDARIPHPLLFAQPRTVAGSQSGITRQEAAVHVQLLYMIEAGRKITLTLGGGPSVVHLGQELVTAVNYDESYPFDAATFKSADTHRATGSATGFNAGADLRWMFTRSVGLGALVRFSRATIDLTTEDKRTLSIQAGGVQGGVGMRVTF